MRKVKSRTTIWRRLNIYCALTIIVSFMYPSVIQAESYGPLDYSVPWDWPSPDEVANALYAAQLLDQKKRQGNGNGALAAAAGGGGGGGGGNGGICSPGSTQTIFNCVITVSTTQIEGSQLTNVTNDNANTVTDPSQSINDSSNNLSTTP